MFLCFRMQQSPYIPESLPHCPAPDQLENRKDETGCIKPSLQFHRALKDPFLKVGRDAYFSRQKRIEYRDPCQQLPCVIGILKSKAQRKFEMPGKDMYEKPDDFLFCNIECLFMDLVT